MATRQRAGEVASAVTTALRNWLWGQAIAMVITGVLTTLGLILVGAPLPMALGLVAAVLDFIPFVGPILAAAPALLLAFTEGPRMVLWVALVYLVVQQVEGNVVQPLVQKQAVDLPPALTVIAAVGMGILFGIPGMIFATPLLVVLMVVVRMVYVEDMLGDTSKP
jgi:predicted PurR-regulated permease PerM